MLWMFLSKRCHLHKYVSRYILFQTPTRKITTAYFTLCVKLFIPLKNSGRVLFFLFEIELLWTRKMLVTFKSYIQACFIFSFTKFFPAGKLVAKEVKPHTFSIYFLANYKWCSSWSERERKWKSSFVRYLPL